MTSLTNVEYAATNIEILQLFVAAIRVVAPDLVQGLLRTSGRCREKAQAIQQTIDAVLLTENFKFGIDVWSWVINRYEPLAKMTLRLSEDPKSTAQHLLKGMIQELMLANASDLEDRSWHPHGKLFQRVSQADQVTCLHWTRYYQYKVV